MSRSKAAITGLGGFTGRHLVERLTREGWDVVGIFGPDENDDKGSLSCDLRDTSALTAWFAEQRPTHVVHLAALSHVVGPALPFYDVNVLGTESVLTAIVRAGITPHRVLLASSANVYGRPHHFPTSEAEPPRPQNHYALSKLAMEGLAQQWMDRLPIVIARPFNYTGPGQSESFLFAKLAAAFHRREQLLELGNLDISRDLSDVQFVVEAYLRLLTRDVAGETYNICSGSEVSLTEALAILTRLTGHEPKITVAQSLVRANDLPRLLGDPAKLQSAVGPLSPLGAEEIFSRLLAALDEA